MAPEAGLEPATNALTGRCSTIELLRITFSGGTLPLIRQLAAELGNIVLLPKNYNLLEGLKSSCKYAKLPP